MARSVMKNANLIAAVADTVFLSISVARRGYSISSNAVRGRNGVVKKGEEMKMAMKKESGDSNSWMPDPVTGYYRPTNRASDVDVADLPKMLLTHKH